MLSAHAEHSDLLKAMHDLIKRSPKQFQHKMKLKCHNLIKYISSFFIIYLQIVENMIEHLDYPVTTCFGNSCGPLMYLYVNFKILEHVLVHVPAEKVGILNFLLKFARCKTSTLSSDMDFDLIFGFYNLINRIYSIDTFSDRELNALYYELHPAFMGSKKL
ncbi:hypothetical protein BpHYR1_029640 [Brachionus plicatilis]|uniref:Uncharacterized protein n=1 Tax=Brachionus plicatilis TaxID=10195 RepID=A0A3M7Q5X9_BRAPC|nr:hypothetical protein BpHYR1_029640 [Brachionus plicatilis]